MGYITSTGEDFALTMRSRAQGALVETLSDSTRLTRIIDLERRNSALVEWVYGVVEEKDDEILNWTFLMCMMISMRQFGTKFRFL